MDSVSHTMKNILLAVAAAFVALGCHAADRKIVIIAGKPSHPPLMHEYRAGALLFAKCLAGFPGVKVDVHSNGWVSDESVFNDAAAVIFYSNGGKSHPLLEGNRLEVLGALMRNGVGFSCLHFAVEPTPEKGEREFIDWLGGAFSPNYSVNPHWDADFVSLPWHPITQGVRPFKTNDEWYFHLRWVEGMKGVTPILTAIAPESTMSRPDGHHSGNPAVRASVAKKEPQHVAWAMIRADGGRSFGFTGGHNHLGWKHADQRKLVLNALLWVAKVEVPANGVESTVTDEDLLANLDVKNAPKSKAARK